MTFRLYSTYLVLLLQILIITNSVHRANSWWFNTKERRQENLSDKNKSKTTITIITSERVGYGNLCDENIYCIPNSQLSCIEGRCECSKPNVMIYDANVSKCLVVSGGKCMYEITTKRSKAQEFQNPQFHEPLGYSSEGNSNEYNYDQYQYESPEASHEILQCVSNSRCIKAKTAQKKLHVLTDEICVCNPGYFEDVWGQCSRKNHIGTNCTTDIECVDQPGVKCSDGVCKCEPMKTVRNSEGQCVGLPFQPCVDNKCAENSVCDGNRCTCAPNFEYDDRKRLCKVKYGKECNNSDECNGSLECLDGVCHCPYTNNQLYDVVQNHCVSLVSAPCSTERDCVPHASCGDHGFKSSTCQCSEGYVESGPGFCRRGQGSPCTSSSSPLDQKRKTLYKVPKLSFIGLSYNSFGSRNGDPELITIQAIDGCDTNRNLACRNGSCSCEPEMEIYDENRGSCVGLVGALCLMDRANYCANHSVCVNTAWNPDNKLGTCACAASGIIPDPTRRCTQNV